MRQFDVVYVWHVMWYILYTQVSVATDSIGWLFAWRLWALRCRGWAEREIRLSWRGTTWACCCRGILHVSFIYRGDAVSWRMFMQCVAACVFVFQLQAEPTRLGPVSRKRAEESVTATGHAQPPPSPRIPHAVPSWCPQPAHRWSPDSLS